jgi:hypothetical protein
MWCWIMSCFIVQAILFQADSLNPAEVSLHSWAHVLRRLFAHITSCYPAIWLRRCCSTSSWGTRCTPRRV